MKYLIAGLGNIGSEYENTRHNIGFSILDRLAQQENLSFSLCRYAFFARWKYRGNLFVLIKPTTYVNQSGTAVRYWLSIEKIHLCCLLVLTDDVALPFGKIRIRAKGSDGGHNGLKHINETLQTQEFARLRFGVGNHFSKGNLADYVLSRWSEEEEKKLPERIDLAIEAIKCFGTLGIERTMNYFNNK
jgi:PTH1 family peptidyl-tRNA hydrolase